MKVGEVTCGGLPHLTCKRDHLKMRDCMDRRVTPPRRVTSPTWGPPPPCKQALKLISRVVKKSSDSLFPSERRPISLQYSEMHSISLRFHCLSPDMFCTAFSHAKPPQNIHAAR